LFEETNYSFVSGERQISHYFVISKKQDRPNITQEKLDRGTIPTNIWDDIPNGLKVKKHSDYFSEKHPKILERIIKTSSNEGDLVADFFLGSGTTVVAAKKLNRNYIGCDINPKAIEITNKRLKDLQV
jgi:DNA modification methylase